MDDVFDTVAVVVFGMMFAASPVLSQDCFGGLPITGVPLREPSDSKKLGLNEFKTINITEFKTININEFKIIKIYSFNVRKNCRMGKSLQSSISKQVSLFIKFFMENYCGICLWLST